MLLTGGLYSPHETVDGAQIADDELHGRARPRRTIAACPVARRTAAAPPWAIRFAELGGRSVEHGYALDEAAATAMAAAGTWLVPTIGVTHDVELMERDQWPAHARERAIATAKGHGEAVLACYAAGVPLAVGADLNPSGPRLHAELRLLEAARPRPAGPCCAPPPRAAASADGLGAATVPRPRCRR